MLIDSEELIRRLRDNADALWSSEAASAIPIVEQMVEEKEAFWAEIQEGGSSGNDYQTYQDTDRISRGDLHRPRLEVGQPLQDREARDQA